MAVKIRLSRKGRNKKPTYSIIVADARAPRDGKFIEKLGTYNPLTSPATIVVDRDRALHWLDNGAQPTDTARAILSHTGVLFKKHLQRGVKKGAFSQEVADGKMTEWLEAKDAKLQDRMKKTVDAAQKDAADRKAAESKIRAAKEAKQAAALVAANPNAADGSQAGDANTPGDAIGEAIANAQSESEEILGIKKEEAPAKEEAPVAKKEAPAKKEETPAAEAKGDDPELDKVEDKK